MSRDAACWSGYCSILLAASTVNAAEGGDGAAQANNPLANMTAFNIQNYYIGDLSESDETANQAWFRFAKPFDLGHSKWLLRASLPVNTFPTPPNGHKETGIGDLNVFAAYLLDVGNPAVSFGVGPQVTAPTAGKDELGSERWSGGLVNVLFNASSPVFQYGYLLSWQHSFAGNDNREDVNAAAFQPFAFYQLGKGTYLRSTPIWSYNFENDAYSVPLGIGIGQVIKKDKTVYNFFIEPQFSVADDGPGQPRWQIFLGLNLQILD
ncbi:hypothetical protein NJF44_07205 [Pseudomonas guariconensis]|uniref:hypothetical protein n=1 Tax=Pseudomonas TaxID=286 RepID=UPI002096E0D3|nr:MULTISPECIES: hypothetical protein [Pseudomonas]MCO7515153.1 hypothetical protein [Pseudomonas putida]MCO7605030.1 hypothetical protein [Pseudomonas guariconensis]